MLGPLVSQGCPRQISCHFQAGDHDLDSFLEALQNPGAEHSTQCHGATYARSAYTPRAKRLYSSYPWRACESDIWVAIKAPRQLICLGRPYDNLVTCLGQDMCARNFIGHIY